MLPLGLLIVPCGRPAAGEGRERAPMASQPAAVRGTGGAAESASSYMDDQEAG